MEGYSLWSWISIRKKQTKKNETTKQQKHFFFFLKKKEKKGPISSTVSQKHTSPVHRKGGDKQKTLNPIDFTSWEICNILPQSRAIILKQSGTRGLP